MKATIIESYKLAMQSRYLIAQAVNIIVGDLRDLITMHVGSEEGQILTSYMMAR